MIPARLFAETWPAAIYAIGDIHGCHRQLVELERLIAEDAAATAGDKWIVTLGDYVDRGPASAAVIEHLLGPAPPGFHRICLRGNHEQMLLDFLADPIAHEYWLGEGGMETLLSYGIDLGGFQEASVVAELLARIGNGVPAAHLEFVSSLPAMLVLPGWTFVHAGIRPDVPLERQSDDDLLWIREPFLSARGPLETRVVHGHTPARSPVVTAARIGIDTQCFKTGRLTALRVRPPASTAFLFAD